MNKKEYIKNPPTIGEILKEEFMEPYNLNQNQLAKLINVEASRISQIVNNKRTITVETDIRLCKLFNLSQGFFLRLQNNIELRELRITQAKELEKIEPLKEALNHKIEQEEEFN